MPPKESTVVRKIDNPTRELKSLKKEVVALKSKVGVDMDESDSEEEDTSSEEEELDLEDVRMLKLLKVAKGDGHGKMDFPMYEGKLDGEELLD